MPLETARTTELNHGITAIDTDHIRPLLAASHLIIEGGRAAFVDTGSSFAVPHLLDGLTQQNIDVGDPRGWSSGRTPPGSGGAWRRPCT